MNERLRPDLRYTHPKFSLHEVQDRVLTALLDRVLHALLNQVSTALLDGVLHTSLRPVSEILDDYLAILRDTTLDTIPNGSL